MAHHAKADVGGTHIMLSAIVPVAADATMA